MTDVPRQNKGRMPAPTISIRLRTVKTPFFWVAFVTAFTVMLLGNMSDATASSTDMQSADAVNQRIAPVANLELVDPNAPAAAPKKPTQEATAVNPAGEKLYRAACFACHSSGVAGAPKFGDRAAWAPYVATGVDAMLRIVMQGKGAMPPKGGAPAASEEDIRAAVQYMIDAAQ